MKVTRTDLGLLLIEPDVHHDERGYFLESYSYKALNKEMLRLGYPIVDFDQDNHSYSNPGVFRGFHYQVPPYAQSKLIWVSHGEIMDMAIDIRPGSLTYGEMEKFTLSETNHRQLFIPQGFAHGFITLGGAKIHYKCDEYYRPGYEGGINPADYVDMDLGRLIISQKDLDLPVFRKHRPFA